MNAPAPDTIVARATPAGRGGVAIVRVSGPAARTIAAQLAGGPPPPRRAVLRPFGSAGCEPLDTGLLLYFPAPHSYTGEDVVEFQLHGSPLLTRMLVDAIVACGARPARAGEFTERAWLNDRLDLAQAEAVADLIDASTEAAARAARRSLAGAFSAAVLELDEQVAALRTWVEAALDFPDEDIDVLDDAGLAARIATLDAAFDHLERTVRHGRLLRDGVQVVIAGRPNAGKSSLLNALAGHDAAIVTDVPGTTRDLVRAELDFDGLPVHVIDTAGLHEAADAIEREGMRRTRAELGHADLILLVIDTTNPAGDDAALRAAMPAGVPVILVLNKIDASGQPAGHREAAGGDEAVGVCALTGAGLDALRARVGERVGYSAAEGTLIARQRHLDALRRARRHFEAGRSLLAPGGAPELFAEEMRAVHAALGEITGEFGTEDLLARIFAGFCIGK